MNLHFMKALLLALVAVIAPSAAHGEVSESLYYTVTKIVSDDGIIHMFVNGRGVQKSTPFKADEDCTVYIGNQELVIGQRVYSNQPGHLYVFNRDGKCVDNTDNAYGKDPGTMKDTACTQIKAARDKSLTYLQPKTYKEQFQEPSFTVEKKEGSGYTSYKIVGNGIVDVVVFTKDEDSTVHTNSGPVLKIGSKVFTDQNSKLFIMTPKGCNERNYLMGRQSDEQYMSEPECRDVKKRMQAAASSNLAKTVSKVGAAKKK